MAIRNLVVYGGAFNPPSIAHITLAKQLANELKAQKLLFVPVGDHYRKKDLLPAYHRVNMLRLACEGNDKLDVSLVEVESERRLYTIETLEKIRKENKNHNIYFLLGTDNLRDIENWKSFEELLEEYKLVVMSRGDDCLEKVLEDIPVLKKYKRNLIQLPGLLKIDISSTLIRDCIRDGMSVENMTSELVSKYIEENDLYKIK